MSIYDGSEILKQQTLQRIHNSVTPLSEQATEKPAQFFASITAIPVRKSNELGIFEKRIYTRPRSKDEKREIVKQLNPVTNFEQSIQKVFDLALQQQTKTTTVAGLIYELKILEYLIEEAKQIGIKTATAYAWLQIAKVTRHKANTLRRYWGKLNDTRVGKKKYTTTINREEALKVSQQIIRKYGLVKYTPKASE